MNRNPTDPDLLYMHPPTFPERHRDGYAEDRAELLTEIHAMRAAIERIKISGHYSAKGLTAEIATRLAAASKVLSDFRKKTVDRLEQRIKEETAAALKPKPSDEDKQLRFQRLAAKRELLAKEDPTKLWQRLKQSVDNGGSEELVAALTLLEPEFPVAPRELIEQTRRAIAERSHPELGELGQLKSAFSHLIGTAAQEIKTIAEANGVNPSLASDAQPYLVSTGEPVVVPVRAAETATRAK